MSRVRAAISNLWPSPGALREAIAAGNTEALRSEAQNLLAGQAAREATGRGYKPEEAQLLQRATQQGHMELHGLRQIQVEDHAGRQSTHFIGDDDGQAWEPFQSPMKIGRLGNPDDFQSETRWWQP